MVADVVVGCHGVLSSEGRVSIQHLIQHNSQTPPVTLHTIPLNTEHLGSNVVWCPHRGVGALSPPTSPALSLVSCHGVGISDGHGMFTWFTGVVAPGEQTSVVLSAVRLLHSRAQTKIS